MPFPPELIESAVCAARLRELRTKWLPGDDPYGSVRKALVNLVYDLRRLPPPGDGEEEESPASQAGGWWDEWVRGLGEGEG